MYIVDLISHKLLPPVLIMLTISITSLPQIF